MNRRSVLLIVSLLAFALESRVVWSQDAGQKDTPGGERTDDGLRPGDEAPTFALKSLDGERTFDLTEFKGKKPVVLFFGSYT